jgi:hypothetical protein
MGNWYLDPTSTTGAERKAEHEWHTLVLLIPVYAAASGALTAVSLATAIPAPQVSLGTGIAAAGLSVTGAAAQAIVNNAETNYRESWEEKINKLGKNAKKVVDNKNIPDELKARILEWFAKEIQNYYQLLCGADYCVKDPVTGKWYPAPPPKPPEDAPANGEGDGDGDGGGDGQAGGNGQGQPSGSNNSQTIDEDSGPRRQEDFLWMSATGRIKAKPKPKKKNDIREYSYERIPLRALLKFREQKNKRNLDGRGPVFSWWKFQAPVVNWDNRMGLLPGNRSGVIDPTGF